MTVTRDLLRLATAAVMAVALAALAAPLAAATLVLTNGETLSGRIVSETAREIRIEVEDDTGMSVRTIAKSLVADVLQPVSAKRLGELTPESPQQYRLYAEELAAKRRDPEAREAATRLFLIAAYLDPEALGRSCLLGMAGLARDGGAARRYRLMAYLLDSTHDERLLANSASRVGDAKDDELQAEMLQVLRWLRAGRRREANRVVNRRPQVLEKLNQMVAPKHLQMALSAVCVDCKEGFIPCPVCEGKKKLPDGSACDRCRVRGTSWGRIKCETCQGKFRDPPSSNEQLLALVEAEYRMTTGKAKAPNRDWSAQAWKQPAVGSLNLLSISPYDPRQCLYQDGKWVAP